MGTTLRVGKTLFQQFKALTRVRQLQMEKFYLKHIAVWRAVACTWMIFQQRNRPSQSHYSWIEKNIQPYWVCAS